MIKNIKKIFNKVGIYIIPTLSGWLGAFGGADKTSKAWRRFAIPGLITSFAYGNTESILTITIMSMSFPLSKGYGIPNGNDEGSSLGRFYYKLFKGNHLLADIFTRGTIGLLIGISLLSIPIIKSNWVIYGIGVLIITLINAFISWQNFGTYNLFKKELSWVETINWGLISLISILIIIL